MDDNLDYSHLDDGNLNLMLEQKFLAEVRGLQGVRGEGLSGPRRSQK